MIDKARDVGDWWSTNPMTYAEVHGKAGSEEAEQAYGDAAFFAEVDRKMFEWNIRLQRKEPFDRIFPYEQFRDKRVLEIGCGMGTMASLWARRGAHVSAVDLAPFSIKMASRRFALGGLTGDIQQADGRTLPFDTGTFDYVYSWGVLHHSPDLARSLREMMRVLKPGGQFGLMLYHRHSLFYWWRIRYREGFVHNERDFLDPVALSSRYTDAAEEEGNPHSWPVTRSEVRQMLGPYVSDLRMRALGGEIDVMLNLMLPGLDRFMPTFAMDAIGRRWSWSLWVSGTRG